MVRLVNSGTSDVIPCVRNVTDVPADFWNWVTGGDTPHLTIDWPFLGDDDRLTL